MIAGALLLVRFAVPDIEPIDTMQWLIDCSGLWCVAVDIVWQVCIDPDTTVDYWWCVNDHGFEYTWNGKEMVL